MIREQQVLNCTNLHTMEEPAKSALLTAMPSTDDCVFELVEVFEITLSIALVLQIRTSGRAAAGVKVLSRILSMTITMTSLLNDISAFSTQSLCQ